MDKKLKMANKFEGVPNEEEGKSQEEIEAGRLSNKDAQEEANMMRATEEETYDHFKSIHLPSGAFDRIWIPKEVTSEDYDKAFEAVEEIKRLAEEEPTTAKVLYQIGTIVHNIGRIPGGIVNGLLFQLIQGTKTEWERSIDRARGKGMPLDEIDDWFKEALTDAGKNLRILKKEGRVYEKRASKEFKETTKEESDGEFKKAA